jgi:hypothetical protein
MTQHRASPAAIVLALVPISALTVGIPIANHVEPRVLGLPFLLAYILIWIVLTPLFMLGVYTIEHRGTGKTGTKGAAQ